MVVERQGDVLYWRRPPGRISYYLVTVFDDKSGKKLLELTKTNEQYITLPSKNSEKLSVEVYT